MDDDALAYRLCSLREEVRLESGPDNQLVLTTMWGDITIADPAPVVRQALERMAMGPVLLDNVVSQQGPQRERVERVLERIAGCVVYSLAYETTSHPLLSVVPIARRARFRLPMIEASRSIKLSRFTATRAVDGELVMESPLARHRVVMHSSRAAHVAAVLSKPVLMSEIAQTTGLPIRLASAIVAHLAAAGMVLIGVGDSPSTALFDEDHDPLLASWAHHELLFHSRHRIGRHDNPLGTVPSEQHMVDVAPAVKPVPDGPRFPLYRPALAEVSLTDPPLTDVIESNTHVRDFSGGEPTVRQLGELLFRAARVRHTSVIRNGRFTHVVTDRPYPSVANRYELDLYLTVDRCAGLDRGIYHYDPQDHALTLINRCDADVGELLDLAMVAAGSPQHPPVLITMTARMARFACASGGIAYSTVLEHVGILQQTLHLIATAMDLAPCGLAFGDSEVASDAFFIDWPAEVSVGEIALGVQPSGHSRIGHSAESACTVDARRELIVTDKLIT